MSSTDDFKLFFTSIKSYTWDRIQKVQGGPFWSILLIYELTPKICESHLCSSRLRLVCKEILHGYCCLFSCSHAAAGGELLYVCLYSKSCWPCIHSVRQWAVSDTHWPNIRALTCCHPHPCCHYSGYISHKKTNLDRGWSESIYFRMSEEKVSLLQNINHGVI